MKLTQFISRFILILSTIAGLAQAELASAGDATLNQQKYDEMLLPNKREVFFSPDRRYFSVLHGDLINVSIYDRQSGLVIKELRHEENISICTFSNDSRYFISASDDGEIKIIDLHQAKETASILCDAGSYSQWFSLENRYLFADDGEGELLLYETETGKRIRMIRYDEDIYDNKDMIREVLFSADGTRAVAGADSGIMLLIQLENGKVLHTLREESGIFKMRASSDNKYMAIRSKNKVKIYDLHHLKLVKDYKFRHNISDINYSKNDDFLIIDDYNKQIHILNLSTGGVQTHKHNHGYSPTPIVFSPDEQSFVIISQKDALALFHKGKRVTTLKDIGSSYDALYSPDSKFLLIKDGARALRLYDVVTGKALAEYPSVHRFAFSPDSHYFAYTANFWEEIDRDFAEVEDPEITTTLNIISIKDLKLIYSANFQDNVGNIIFTPDSKSLIIDSRFILHTIPLP